MTSTGEDYIGKTSSTRNGFTCQLWVGQGPHTHNFTEASLLPDRSLEEAENHCRNPGGRRLGGPWCYVTDPAVEWDYCDLVLCDGVKETTGDVTEVTPPPPSRPTTSIGPAKGTPSL